MYGVHTQGSKIKGRLFGNNKKKEKEEEKENSQL
jgi:hypothetical protein